jgi:hypothetical protein
LEKKKSNVNSTNFSIYFLKVFQFFTIKKMKKKALISMKELVSLIREIGEWCDESWQG